MLPNETEHVAKLFYDAFGRRDSESMVALYHENSQFHDPVFRSLKAADAKDMWRMLCKQASDLRVEFTVTKSRGQAVTVLWEARYTFTKTGRKVHNRVESDLVIQDGKIVSQKDRFSFWRWSSQAFGMAGVLLGWSPVFKRIVYKNALISLNKYQLQTSKDALKNL